MTSLRSLDPRVFLRAAEELARKWPEEAIAIVYPLDGCCTAIARQLQAELKPLYLRFFAEVFKPGPGDYPSMFPEPYERAGYWWDEAAREPRLIALCLAAAILEDEQAKKPKRRRRRVSIIR